jgi:tRNA pseudouridine55 synthase
MDQNFQLPNINGWLVIDKPSGIGSTNIVNLVKKKVPSTKVGHGGTLDPDATGLLPIAIGEATKTIRFTENLLKTYEFTVTLALVQIQTIHQGR